MNIRDQDGIERESHEDIENTLVKHFQGIDKDPNWDRSMTIESITQHILKLVTYDKNVSLFKPIAEEVIDQVVQEMPNGKAPGRDHFIVKIFKACWDVVKYEIYGVVQDSRRLASILKALNATMLTLIPK